MDFINKFALRPSQPASVFPDPEAARAAEDSGRPALPALLGALLLAALVKALLLYFDAVPFNGDEAVVALMARHILQGARPVFFYGQAYMGSLDAWLVSLAFRRLGEGVTDIRVVQSALYLLYLLTLWLLARRLFFDGRVASAAVWLAAVPTVLVSTYTTASLGGYGESLVFGNLILLLGYEAIYGRWQEKGPAWLALGLVGGLAFWTLGMAGVYLLPVAVLGLLRFGLRRPGAYALAALGFFAGSSPWWAYNLTHHWAAFGDLGGVLGVESSLIYRLTGFLLLGIPALLGWRWPWTGSLAPWPHIVLTLLVYLAAALTAVHLLRHKDDDGPVLSPGAGRLLALFSLVSGGAIILSHIGIDSSGRYFLPLYLPLVLLLALFVARVWRWRAAAGLAAALLIIGANALEIGRAAADPQGLTTQFDPISAFNNRHDDELMAFLREQGETRGYSNYWVTFRLAFLSGEELIFAPHLPYKADLRYNPRDDRYPAYTRLVESSPHTAYITTQHPRLDELLRTGFARLEVSFQERQIGPYRVYYGLSRPVRPDELEQAAGGFTDEHP